MFYMFSCIVKIYGKIKYSKESQQNMSQFSCYYSCAHNTVSSANIRQTEDSVSSAGYNDRFHRISAKIWSLSPASLSGNPWFTTRSTGVAPISFEISGPLLLWARSPPASGPPRPRPLLLPPPQPQPTSGTASASSSSSFSSSVDSSLTLTLLPLLTPSILVEDRWTHLLHFDRA